jgi:hypothetical protein
MKKATKKVEEVEKEQENEIPRSEVRNYFTPEVLSRINEMSDATMYGVLKEFIDTEAWIALVKWTSKRLPLLDANLRSANPYVDPYKIAWTQGVQAGMCDVENLVIDLNKPKTVEDNQE